MLFLGIGLVLLTLKWLEIGFIANWDWWQVLLPFLLAFLWWAWADWSGYSKRKEAEKMERRRLRRIAKSRAALRAPPPRPR